MAKPKSKPQAAQEVAKPYEATPHELKSLSANENRRTASRPRPRMKAHNKTEDPGHIIVDHQDPETGYGLMAESLGTANKNFLIGIISELGCITADAEGQVDIESLNHGLSLAQGIQPRDEIETMLATQMAAVHMATIVFARRLQRAQNSVQRESAERGFNKLARTFVAQVEALKRHRSKGEQRVYVERVNVNEGGQAIVGNVSRGVGE